MLLLLWLHGWWHAGLLEWEESKFPLLGQMFATKEPYEKLWNNALNFTIKSEQWMNGACGGVVPVWWCGDVVRWMWCLRMCVRA